MEQIEVTQSLFRKLEPGHNYTEYELHQLHRAPHEQLPSNNEERWLMLQPPVYRNLGLNGPVFGIGPAGWAEVFRQAAEAWDKQKQAQLHMLRALYTMCTRLPGITVWHNPAYLLRDLEVLKRRVLAWEVLQNRLREVADRDRLEPGRIFYSLQNPSTTFTITRLEGDQVYFKPNRPNAPIDNQPLATMRRLTAINSNYWRLLPPGQLAPGNWPGSGTDMRQVISNSMTQ